jgi:hypothetical protein
MLRFHEHRLAGSDAARALAQAVDAEYRDGRAPHYWAGFFVMGTCDSGS